MSGEAERPGGAILDGNDRPVYELPNISSTTCSDNDLASTSQDDQENGDGRLAARRKHRPRRTAAAAAAAAAASGGSSREEAEEGAGQPLDRRRSTRQTAHESSNGGGGEQELGKEGYLTTRSSVPSRGIDKDKMAAYRLKRAQARRAAAGDLIYKLKDRTLIHVNDCIYLIAEPPSDPYYIGRVMEFLTEECPSGKSSGDGGEESDTSEQSKNGDAAADRSTPIRFVRVNWFYRPKDVQRRNRDSRLLYASMHSDVCPVAAIRGKCKVTHRQHLHEDLETVYRKKPHQFWFDQLFDRYIHRFYEVVPTEDIMNAPDNVLKTLRSRWDFVIVESGRRKELCMQTRACKRCGTWCSSAESIRCAVCHADYHLQCLKPPLSKKPSKGFAWTCTNCARSHLKKAEEKDSAAVDKTSEGTSMHSSSDSEEGDEAKDLAWANSMSSDMANTTEQFDDFHFGHSENNLLKATNKLHLWPFRYLGVHCRLEDVLDIHDRINPRASSRVGPRFQAYIPDWPGQPVQYYDRARSGRHIGRKRRRGGYQISYEQEEDLINMPNQAYRPWLQPKPFGYISRGEDSTSSSPLFIPLAGFNSFDFEQYISKLEPIAKRLEVQCYSTDFLDHAMQTLYRNNFDEVSAIQTLHKLTRTTLKLPNLSTIEKQKFEQGVAKYGSELQQVAEHIGTKPIGEVVKYYYMWKKSLAGREIWGTYPGRHHPEKHLNAEERAKRTGNANSADDDNFDADSDDSAFNVTKATSRKKTFICALCEREESKRWQKAPATFGTVLGTNVAKGNKILALCDRCGPIWRYYAVQWEYINDYDKKITTAAGRIARKWFEEEIVKNQPAPDDVKYNMSAPSGVHSKSTKTDTITGGTAGQTKKWKKVKERSPPPEPEPIPCRICSELDMSLESAMCSTCGLVVHHKCYGIVSKELRHWRCDPCINDENLQMSSYYRCVLCPNGSPDTGSHEPLKPTLFNEWAHVTCAIWHSEVRFGNASTLSPVENVGTGDPRKWDVACTICNRFQGACVSCHACHAHFHVSCAAAAGYTLAFHIQPVKASRKEQVHTVKFGGENGVMNAVIWCPEHNLCKMFPHPANEQNADGETALTVFVKTYKQADQTVPINLRKSNMIASIRRARNAMPISGVTYAEGQESSNDIHKPRHCIKCHVDVAPYWWPTTDCDSGKHLCHQCHWKEKHFAQEDDEIMNELLNIEEIIPAILQVNQDKQIDLVSINQNSSIELEDAKRGGLTYIMNETDEERQTQDLNHDYSDSMCV